MKKFIHYELPRIEQINSPQGRRYRTPEGNEYTSITTALSGLGADYLEAWRSKVGQEEADKISRRASKKGSLVHAACEDYLMGKPTEWGPFDQEARECFTQFRPVLDSIQEIHAIEAGLYSDRLKLAGTVDLIARIDNKLYILDWKSSRRFKAREDISGYFMQAAAYGVMFYERTGVMVNGISIQLSTEEAGLVTYNEPVVPWAKKLVEYMGKIL